MAEFPALTLWTDAYLSDTRFLTTMEHGAYLLLLMEAWRRPNCDLPDDDQMLSRMVGLSLSEWTAIRPTIMAYWKLDKRSKVWKQKRLSRERDAARIRSKSQRDKAAKRWNNDEKKNATALPGKSRGNASTATATATAIIDDTPNGVLATGEPDALPDEPDFQLELEVEDQPPAEPPLTPEDILETWNDMAPRYGLPIVRGKLNDTRLKQCRARIRDFPDREDWARAFRCIAATKWMHGENDRGWRADFDFLVQSKSFTKLVEGTYGQD